MGTSLSLVYVGGDFEADVFLVVSGDACY